MRRRRVMWSRARSTTAWSSSADAVAASCELPVRRAGRTVAMPGEVAELSWVREPVDLVPLAAGPALASAVSGRSGSRGPPAGPEALGVPLSSPIRPHSVVMRSRPSRRSGGAARTSHRARTRRSRTTATHTGWPSGSPTAQSTTAPRRAAPMRRHRGAPGIAAIPVPPARSTTRCPALLRAAGTRTRPSGSRRSPPTAECVVDGRTSRRPSASVGCGKTDV